MKGRYRRGGLAMIVDTLIFLTVITIVSLGLLSMGIDDIEESPQPFIEHLHSTVLSSSIRTGGGYAGRCTFEQFVVTALSQREGLEDVETDIIGTILAPMFFELEERGMRSRWSIQIDNRTIYHLGTIEGDGDIYATTRMLLKSNGEGMILMLEAEKE